MGHEWDYSSSLLKLLRFPDHKFINKDNKFLIDYVEGVGGGGGGGVNEMIDLQNEGSPPEY